MTTKINPNLSSTPTNLADLHNLWSHLDVWREIAKQCLPAEVTVDVDILPGARGGVGTLAQLRLKSNITGGHSITEPITFVGDLTQATKRFVAHVDGFMLDQPDMVRGTDGSIVKKAPTPTLLSAEGLLFGCRDPNFTAPALWGCRAINEQRTATPYLDIVWDRQSAIGPVVEKKALCMRLDGEDGRPSALKAFCDAYAAGGIETDNEMLEFEIIHGVEFIYKTAGGYCYISARLTDKADTFTPPKTKKARR
jgi:hypothetical protein